MLYKVEKKRKSPIWIILLACITRCIKADKKISEIDLESGSTGTVCLLTLEEAKRILYVAHVGDSTAFLFDDNNYEKLTN